VTKSGAVPRPHDRMKEFASPPWFGSPGISTRYETTTV
jgi:hypothetical protein